MDACHDFGHFAEVRKAPQILWNVCCHLKRLVRAVPTRLDLLCGYPQVVSTRQRPVHFALVYHEVGRRARVGVSVDGVHCPEQPARLFFLQPRRRVGNHEALSQPGGRIYGESEVEAILDA